MKKSVITVIVVAIVLFLLALPKLGWLKKDDGEDPKAGGPSALLCDGVVVKPAHLDNKLIVTGSVIANESLELKSEISGKITAITFREGSRVKKGTELIQINDDEIRAQLLKQKYNKKLNEENEYRERKLLEKDAISQEEYDIALNSLKTNDADIEVLEAQLEKTRLVAPFDGVVGLRYVSEGAYITPATVIASFYSMSPAKIEFAVPGRYSTEVRSGKKVIFTIENDTTPFQGEVYAVEPQIDPNTRTLKIRALADNSKGLLIPGQFVKVEVILQSIDNALLAPTEAVVPELDGHRVFLAKGNKAKEVPVQIGIRTDRDVEILSGLSAGDTLITSGLLTVKDGMPLNIQMKE